MQQPAVGLENLQESQLPAPTQEQLKAQAELRRLAESHIGPSAGKLVVLDGDPAESGQRPDIFYLPGQPVDIAEMQKRSVGEPRMELLAARFAEEDSRQRLSELGARASHGENVFVITPHGDINDTGQTLAAMYAHLLAIGAQDFRTGIIISHIVKYLGYRQGEEVIPAVQMLQSFCHDIYFSYPLSTSIETSSIDGEVIHRTNRQMVRALLRNLNHGSNIIAMAPSGARLKADSQDPRRTVLGRVEPPTIKLLMGKDTKVLPVAALFRPDRLIWEWGDFATITESQQLHDIMTALAETLSREAGMPFAYNCPPAQQLGKVALA